MGARTPADGEKNTHHTWYNTTLNSNSVPTILGYNPLSWDFAGKKKMATGCDGYIDGCPYELQWLNARVRAAREQHHPTYISVLLGADAHTACRRLSTIVLVAISRGSPRDQGERSVPVTLGAKQCYRSMPSKKKDTYLYVYIGGGCTHILVRRERRGPHEGVHLHAERLHVSVHLVVVRSVGGGGGGWSCSAGNG